MFEIKDEENKAVGNFKTEQEVAAFYAGVIACGREPLEFNLFKDGALTIKTFIINKYLSK